MLEPSNQDPHLPTPGRPLPPEIAPDLRRTLLDLARAALEVAVGRRPVSTLQRALADADGARPPSGSVFVTLEEDDELRGCIGSLATDRSLPDAVVSSALGAALDDPRFRPVTAEELPMVQVDVSVLGLATPIEDAAAFRPGTDGVIVERGGHKALLLPEVATSQAWGAVEMFDAVCRKAGLPAGAWRDPGTHLSAFRTVRFGGPALIEARRPTPVG